MIDFRYHLVSLVSVFLALAVGIVLGAGPLREPIGNALSGQVEKLREDRDTLRTDLDKSKAVVAEQTEYLQAANGVFAANTLKGRQIAYILLPGANIEDLQAVEHTLQAAGATTTAVAEVTANWFSEKQATFNRNLAGQIAGYLKTKPAANAAPETPLVWALAQSLSELGNSEAVLAKLLSGGDAGLVKYSQQADKPADAVVIIAPSLAPTASASPAPAQVAGLPAPETIYLELARAVRAHFSGAVAIGSAAQSSDVIASLRAGGAPIATIDSANTGLAKSAVALVMGKSFQGEYGAWGSETGAEHPFAALLKGLTMQTPSAPVPTPPGGDAASNAEPTSSPNAG